MNLPQSWNEITAQQFIRVAAVLASDCDLFAGQVKLLWILSGLKAKKFSKIDTDELPTLIEKIEWCRDLTIDKCFFPEIKHNGIIFHGPGDGLDDMVLDQFIAADHFFIAYHQDKNPETLNALISVLYLNQEFQEKTFLKTADRFANLDEDLKAAIYINYMGMRNFFIKLYPGPFSSKKGDGEMPTMLDPWSKLKDDLAGDKFGFVSTIGSQSLHLIFKHLQNNAEKAVLANINEA
jgi:hypothetical protein